jgi:hypothetical protein
MARRRLDLKNHKFGRLKVVREAGVAKNGDALWECECACGEKIVARACNLRSGNTSSCGCLFKEKHTTHGLSHLPEYCVWEGIVQRCTNPKSASYEYYGGRGITICDRWRDFENFFKDMGPRQNKELSIDRIDPNGNYEKSNCRWASKKDQALNTRNFKTSKTGVRGVIWVKAKQKYKAEISVNNKTKHIGMYDSIDSAKEARVEAEIKFWGKECYR